MERTRTCCSIDDVEDAKSVAFKLGFPHYTFNFKAMDYTSRGIVRKPPKKDWICLLTFKKTYTPLLHLISQCSIPWKGRMAQYFVNFAASLFQSALYRV